MDKDENLRLPRIVTPSKPSSNDRLSMRNGGRERLGIYLESTEDEQWGVLPHECTRIKDARGLTALPVRDSSRLFSGRVTEALGTMVIFLFVAPLNNRLLAFRGLVSRCHSGAPAVRITSRESSRTDCAPSFTYRSRY